jgi:hypothetical protein
MNDLKVYPSRIFWCVYASLDLSASILFAIISFTVVISVFLIILEKILIKQIASSNNALIRIEHELRGYRTFEEYLGSEKRILLQNELDRIAKAGLCREIRYRPPIGLTIC